MADDHLVGELGEGHRGESEVEPLQAQRRECDERTERCAHQHHQQDAVWLTVLTAEVRVEESADPGDREVGEAQLSRPAGERHQREHDEPEDQESGAPPQPDLGSLAEGRTGEPRDPAVGPDHDDAHHRHCSEEGFPRSGDPLGPPGRPRVAGLQPGLRQEHHSDEEDHGGDGFRRIPPVGSERHEDCCIGRGQADDHGTDEGHRDAPQLGDGTGSERDDDEEGEALDLHPRLGRDQDSGQPGGHRPQSPRRATDELGSGPGESRRGSGCRRPLASRSRGVCGTGTLEGRWRSRRRARP